MRPDLDTDFFSLPSPRAIAHRGASGTHPENTMAAFKAAYEVGARYIELDVHTTRDGKVVVLHDADLARTTGRQAAVSSLNHAELAALDAGFGFASDAGHFPFRGQGIKVPTLSEVLVAFPELRFIIEIKPDQPDLVEAMLEDIDGAA